MLSIYILALVFLQLAAGGAESTGDLASPSTRWAFAQHSPTGSQQQVGGYDAILSCSLDPRLGIERTTYMTAYYLGGSGSETYGHQVVWTITAVHTRSSVDSYTHTSQSLRVH